MRFNIWTIINTVFYYCSLFAMVFIIIKTDWNSLESLEVFYICGTLGGIMYLGDIFRKEITTKYVQEANSSQNLNKPKETI